jgi:hypothetical protein
MNGMRIRRRLQALGFCAVVAVAACGAPDQAAAPQGVFVDPEPGEVHLQNIQKLTFGGNNAEGYFSRSGEQIIFQRQEQVSDGCDQQYIINVDGTGLRRVSNGQGRTTCGYFYDDDRRILYSSTFEHSPACPAPPDHSQGYVWPIGHFEIYTSAPDGSDPQKLTDNGTYNAEATLSPDGSRILHNECGWLRSRTGDEPGGLRRGRVLLTGWQHDRVAGGISRDGHRLSGLFRPARTAHGPSGQPRDPGREYRWERCSAGNGPNASFLLPITKARVGAPSISISLAWTVWDWSG